MENTIYLYDEFVSVTAGNPFRLFPFGTVYKGGKKHEITPEYAGRMKLPHFKPPIKLSSHEDNAPAGGFIVGLEVREDGLYALPEWNEAGQRAMQDGAYRYQSPEIIWEGGFEDPKTGNLIEGPLIVGAALLHMPHLGDDVALYHVEPIEKGDNPMTVEKIEIPKGLYEKFSAWLDGLTNKPPEQLPAEPVKVEESDEFKAVAQERDSFKAELDALKAEQAKREAVSKFEGELKDAKADPELAEILAGLTPEQAEPIMRQIKALAAQTEVQVEGEVGDGGSAAPAGDNPAAEFDAEIKRIQAEEKVDYGAALLKVAQTKPELYDAYVKARKPKE